MEKILTFQEQIQLETNKNLKIINYFNKCMKRLTNREKRLAECVGLWLAEGSTKSKVEITFTNSCLELIDLFKRTINKIFKGERYNQRIYIYSKTGEKLDLPYKNCVLKFYTHKRATKPFMIYRVASVKLRNKWQEIIGRTLNKQELSPYILRGFFAGEGNIKDASHNSRVLRISQKIQKEFIDNALNYLNIKYRYIPKEMSYDIYGKWNWDIFAKLKLADLHPDKKKKFWHVYSKFKEEHYEHNFIKNNILNVLNEPKTSRQLAEIFKRTPARIQDIIIELKKQGKINNFRVRSVDYWTKNKGLVIISRLKNDYLLFLDMPKQTSEFAKHFKVNWKSSFRRLEELKNLNLTRREPDGRWIRIATDKEILVI